MQPPLAQPLIDLLIEHEVAEASERVAGIVVAVDVLTRNPMIDRPKHPFESWSSGAGRAGTWPRIDMRPTTMPCMSSVSAVSARRGFRVSERCSAAARSAWALWLRHAASRLHIATRYEPSPQGG